MPKGPKGMTIDEIEEQLRNDVCKAAHWFEVAEDAGLIHGNGHHMAQQLARDAVEMLMDRVVRKRP